MRVFFRLCIIYPYYRAQSVSRKIQAVAQTYGYLLLQYHFNAKGKFRPYLGAGINYTISYLENADRSLEAVLGPKSVKAKRSLGWVVQAGMD